MVTIEVLLSEKQVFENLQSKYQDFITLVTLRRFDGQPEILQVLVILTSVTIPAIAKIVIELIRSRKHVSLKVNGIEVKGISEENIFNILKEIQSKEKTKKSK
jgi:putative effector of murein hydrolase